MAGVIVTTAEVPEAFIKMYLFPGPAAARVGKVTATVPEAAVNSIEVSVERTVYDDAETVLIEKMTEPPTVSGPWQFTPEVELVIAPAEAVRPPAVVINPEVLKVEALAAWSVVEPAFIRIPLLPVIKPNTLSGDVVPVVPTFAVCPVATVSPPFAVISPVAEIVDEALNVVPDIAVALIAAMVAVPLTERAAKFEVPDDVILVMVAVPKTFSALVAPLVPTFTVWPLALVIPAFADSKPLSVAAVRLDVPNTFSVLVAPLVPTLTVWPFETVIPSVAVSRPLKLPVVAVKAAKLEVPADIVRPLLPVIKPKTLSGDVVPLVPMFTVCPFALVIPAFAVRRPLKVDVPDNVRLVHVRVVILPFLLIIPLKYIYKR